MKTINRTARFAFAALASLGTAQIATAQLSNGSFETAGTGGAVFADWIDYGNSAGNVSQVDGTVQAPADGTFSCKLYGQFNFAQNDTVLIQGDIPASEGQEMTASAKVLHQSADALQGGNILLLVLDFLDSGGTVISNNGVTVLDETMPTDQWLDGTVTATAPAGTASAQVVIVFVQLVDPKDPFNPGQPGAAFIDDVSIDAGTGPCGPADFDGNGRVDTSDFIAFLNAFVAGCD